MKGHYQDIFKRQDRFWNGVLFLSVVISILLSCLRCSDEYYFGKSREDLTREMFEVDSLIRTIQLELDSTSLDFEKFYINGQRINNGHN